MSYDLMVFEKTKAPKTRKAFMDWYFKQVEWEEEHDYQSPEVTSPALKSWYLEMMKTYPPMNGEGAPDCEALEADGELESRLTDYSIGHDVIYAAFAWSQAERSYRLMKKLAQKHGVGFFNVSSDEGEILFPDGTEL